MHRITDEQIDFILSDFERHGIVLEDLRDNLLDHMCCIIESEMDEGDNFYRFYESVFPRFFKENLGEIQIETDNLLRFKNFYSMIRTMKITGLLTVAFTIVGAIFKTLHLPGAGIMIILGGFIFSFIFLPLLIALKFRDEESKTDKYVFSFGLLLAIILAVGLIIKLMHWPGATILMLTGTIGITFVYAPLYFFTRYRRADVRMNTIVNSVLMMACGGIFFALFNLGYSKNFTDYLVENHIYLHESSEKLFTSNERLYAENSSDSVAVTLHEATKQVNDAVEKLAAVILKDMNTKNISPEKKELISAVQAYNNTVGTQDKNEIQSLDLKPLEVLHKFSIETAMNALARVQQEIAVNENCYLTSTMRLAQSN